MKPKTWIQSCPGPWHDAVANEFDRVWSESFRAFGQFDKDSFRNNLEEAAARLDLSPQEMGSIWAKCRKKGISLLDKTLVPRVLT